MPSAMALQTAQATPSREYSDRYEGDQEQCTLSAEVSERQLDVMGMGVISCRSSGAGR